jgi:FkbM family methyltransferase
MIKRLLVKIWLYFKYPNKLREDIIKCVTQGKANKLGLHTFPPNYIYLDVFDKESHIIDIGCGFKAEFSCHLIEKYGLKAFGVDPTRKHKEFLQKIESKYKGNFKHVEVAISKSNTELTFYETQENESGSLLSDHQNILHDTVVSYPVVSKNIQSLLADLGISHADLLKIDIEGAEYELLENFTPETFQKVGQIFIEFHHHAFKKYHRKHTKRIVKRIKRSGFSSFTRDGNNYLFYSPGLIRK